MVPSEAQSSFTKVDGLLVTFCKIGQVPIWRVEIFCCGIYVSQHTPAKVEAIRIGTAGWSVPNNTAVGPKSSRTQLERYSSLFSCVEINSSFYRPHKAATYERWAASVPTNFRFAVKAPREITHELRLRNAGRLLGTFFDQISNLGQKLGPVLLQLPPSLNFDPAVAADFMTEFRGHFEGEAVLEPRHLTWFEPEADDLMRTYHIGRVAADPARCSEAAVPGGAADSMYWRLHGSPRTYWTPYGKDRLRSYAERLTTGAWCVLDNTASGAAFQDALLLLRLTQNCTHPA